MPPTYTIQKTKRLTAALGSYAQVTGKLSLSDHASKFVPGLRGKAIDRATLLHFGTYTAGGLPLQFPDTVKRQKAMLAYYADWVPVAKPGTQRQYLNPSLGLFGLAASNSLGRSFADAMKPLVFPAFGMASTLSMSLSGPLPTAHGVNGVKKRFGSTLAYG